MPRSQEDAGLASALGVFSIWFADKFHPVSSFLLPSYPILSIHLVFLAGSFDHNVASDLGSNISLPPDSNAFQIPRLDGYKALMSLIRPDSDLGRSS